MKKRILFVFDIGFDREGPSVHLLKDILRATLSAGNYVDVILKDTSGPDEAVPVEFRNDPSFCYYLIKEKDTKKGGFAGRYIREIVYAKRCSQYYRHKKYDAVFLQSNVAAFFYLKDLRKLKCKIVFNVQDIFPYNLKYSRQLPLERIAFPIFRKLQNYAYLKSDVIVTISDDMKQTLIKDGVPADRIRVVYNWSYADTPIMLDRIKKDRIYDLNIDKTKFNVVYAGNIGKMQNVELVANTAKVMANNGQVHFYIVGDGISKNKVKCIVDDLNNVTLLPMQSSKYAESIYAQADLNIIPLAEGGIKTALPSKTATVLRVNKPIVFCIDDESELKHVFSGLEGVYFSGCQLENDLARTIEMIRKKGLGSVKRECISLMSRRNAEKYVEILRKD